MRKVPYALSLALLAPTGCGEDPVETMDSGITTTMSTLGTGDTGDGSGGTGDGDGSTNTGDGTSGDGDGSTGDGDGSTGDGTSGDGTSGDGTTGDGDGATGDGTSGDGDGSATGDGDGSATGDGTSGDGDGSATGDGTSGDGDGTATATGDGDGDGCFNEQFSFNSQAPNVVLVLDQSGSMSSTYDHDNNAGTPNVSRWEALHIAVTDILNLYDNQVRFGVVLFPNDSNCGVNTTADVPCNIQNAATILGFIPGPTVSPNGLTPSGEGLETAINYLTALNDPGQKAIIFMADGDTNCNYSIGQIETLLQNAFNGGNPQSIITYVVGINASGSTVTELNQLAVAGGAPLVPMMGTPFWTDSFETGDFSAGAYTPAATWAVDNADASDGTFSAVGTGLAPAAPTMFADDFESGGLGANPWGSGGTPSWVVDATSVQTGSFAAHNANIGDSQESDLTYSASLSAAGTLNFGHSESTESCCDHLELWVDGSMVQQWSGSNGWASESIPLTAGSHSIIFRYDKDGSVSTGDDNVYLDNVSISVPVTQPVTAEMTLDVNFAVAGHAWFNHKSTASGADGLTFMIDGAVQGSWTGTTGWGESYYPVNAGNHTLSWRQTSSNAADSVRVDNVRLEEGGVYSSNSFYDAQNTTEFYQALDQIIGGLVTCDLVLNPPPPDPNQVDVAVGGVTLPKLDPTAPGFDCATDYGWYYSSMNVATLCGTACIDFQAMSMPTADVTYYCMAS
jgi:hypothetical protein